MHRFAHDVVAAERERQIADPAADLDAGTGRLDDPRRFDEVDRVGVVLFETGRDRQNVRIENDVGGIESGPLGEQPVRALADRDLPLDGVRLALFVERHHHHAGAEPADDRRLVQEVAFAFLEADRVDDRLALHALETGENHRPFRAVDHERHAGDLGLGRDVVQEFGHRALGIEHAFVHVDVDQVRAATHLVERHPCGFRVLLGSNQPRESCRAGDVGALPDHLKVGVGANRQRLEARELSKSIHHGGHGGYTRTERSVRLSPCLRVSCLRGSAPLGATPSTAFAIAAMCSGVVPQQPPTIFRKPLSANSRKRALV